MKQSVSVSDFEGKVPQAHSKFSRSVCTEMCCYLYVMTQSTSISMLLMQILHTALFSQCMLDRLLVYPGSTWGRVAASTGASELHKRKGQGWAEGLQHEANWDLHVQCGKHCCCKCCELQSVGCRSCTSKWSCQVLLRQHQLWFCSCMVTSVERFLHA